MIPPGKGAIFTLGSAPGKAAKQRGIIVCDCCDQKERGARKLRRKMVHAKREKIPQNWRLEGLTPCEMMGLHTGGSISLGWAVETGRRRVPSSATADKAL